MVWKFFKSKLDTGLPTKKKQKLDLMLLVRKEKDLSQKFTLNSH